MRTYLELESLRVSDVYSGDIDDVAFESCRDVVARAQRKRKTLGEAGGRDAFTQQVCQLVERELLCDAAGCRRTTSDVVVAVRNSDVLNDVACMDHIVARRRNLTSQTTSVTLVK